MNKHNTAIKFDTFFFVKLRCAWLILCKACNVSFEVITETSYAEGWNISGFAIKEQNCNFQTVQWLDGKFTVGFDIHPASWVCSESHTLNILHKVMFWHFGRHLPSPPDETLTHVLPNLTKVAPFLLRCFDRIIVNPYCN